MSWKAAKTEAKTKKEKAVCRKEKGTLIPMAFFATTDPKNRLIQFS